MNIEEVPVDARGSLRPVLDESFTGLYRWHARRTLRSVAQVRKATRDGVLLGFTMSTMVRRDIGYIYYAAVTTSARAQGVGGALLDDALQRLRADGAQEFFACARKKNKPAVRLLQSRNFVRTTFHEVALAKGFADTVRLWVRMVVAPGESVYVRWLRSG
jgi:ribosomal protein S18 acetylase RimI-like enzyme